MNLMRSAIYGLAIGDALGVPFEFKARGTYTATDMTGYGTHFQPAGTWSDDTSMTIATCASIKRKRAIDCSDIMKNFHDWYYNGAYTPDGTVLSLIHI